MYEQFFQLHTKPFTLLPNPDFMYRSRTHRKALNYLSYGIQERMGFILFTGEVGAGKTTIIQELLRSELDRMVLAKVFNTRVDSHQLLGMINDDFGLDIKGKDKSTLLRDLNDFLIEQYQRGGQCVLVIDEAQNLSLELLEEIRLLSNLETEEGKLLQIILVGQPELRATLKKAELMQLRQRIQVFCHLGVLTEEEVGEYIRFRMERAGNRNALLFDAATEKLIHKYTRGIPRMINTLCDYILLDMFMNRQRVVTSGDVEEIVADLNFEEMFWASSGNGSGEAPAGGGQSRSAASASKVVTLLERIDSRLDTLEHFVTRYKLSVLDVEDRVANVERKLGAS